MIIVEGPDGAGKTTLIRELRTQFAVTVAPRVVAKNTTAMLDLKRWVEEQSQMLNQGVVFDRHRLISEMVYGPIMRPHKPEPGFEDWPWLSSMLNRFYQAKPTLIYCLPSLDVVRANIVGDGENKEVSPNIDLIYRAYCHRIAIDQAHNIGVHYDYTEGPGHLRSIMGYVNRNEMF